MPSSASENQSIQGLVSDLKKFVSVSKKLQSGGSQSLDLLEARSLFQGLVSDFQHKYPLSHLRTESNIITNPNFENGVIKILDYKEIDLNQAVATSCSIFRKSIDRINEPDSPGNALGYADQLLFFFSLLTRRDLEKIIQNIGRKSTYHQRRIFVSDYLAERSLSCLPQERI